MFSLDDVQGALHHFEEKPKSVTAKRIDEVKSVQTLTGERRNHVRFVNGTEF